MSIEEKLKGRLKKAGFPLFWQPQRVGDEISGEVVRIRSSPWTSKSDYDKNVYEIKALNGETISLPLHTVLMRVIIDEGVKVGDYVMAKYTGEQKSKAGRMVKGYEIAVLPKEEAGPKELRPKSAEVRPPGPPEPTSEGLPKPKGKIEEIKKFVDELFSYYDSLTVEELGYYLNTIKKWDIDPAIVIKELGLKVENGKVSK